MKFNPGTYHQLPDNIHLAVNNVYELAVLNYLLQCCDGKNECFPGQDKIAQGMMSTKQVQRACNNLQERGFITIKRERMHRGVRHHYSINIENILQRTNSPVDTQTTGQIERDNGVTESVTEGDNRDANSNPPVPHQEPTPKSTTRLTVHQHQTDSPPAPDPQSDGYRTDSPHNHTHINHTQEPNPLTKTLSLEDTKGKNEGERKGVYGENRNVFLTDAQHFKIVEKIGPDKTDEYIQKISDYMQSTGKDYDDHYAAISLWIRRDEDKSPISSKNSRRDTEKYFKGKYGHLVQK